MTPTNNTTPSGDTNPIPDTAQTKSSKTWGVGTLIYTRASLATLFAWLFWGDFGWQLRERAVGPVATLLLKHLHSSDKLIGLLIGSIPSALGLMLGPVINTYSDRYRSKRGRRIPFLLVPIPFTVLALVGLAFTSQIGSSLHDALGTTEYSVDFYRRIVFGIFWTTFEIAAIATSGIFYALVNDVVPHSLIGRSFGFFRAISLLAGIIFNYWIIGHAEQHYVAIFIGSALTFGIGLTMMCLKVKEGEYPPPEPMVNHGKDIIIGPIKTYFRDTFSLPYYRWVYVATTLALLEAGPVNSFSILFAKSVGMSVARYGKYVALTYAISFCLSYLLGWLADRFHPLRITIASVAMYAVFMLAGGFLARTPQIFAIAFVAHGVLSGCLFTAIVPTFQRLFPKARFGEFYSATGVLTGLSFMILPPAVGAFLDATGHVYRYTFIIGGLFAIVGLVSLLIVHRQFMALGGPEDYIAPE